MTHACKDCIHFILPTHANIMTGRCGHEFEINFITGERDYKFAELMRKHGPCTPHGVYFEPKIDPRHQERDDHDGEPINGRPF